MSTGNQQSRSTTWILAIATVGMFALANSRHQALIDLRSQDQIHLHSGIRLENTTPLMAVSTVALGGFRGLIADVLWLRATKLQDEGLYFENAQLADWITKLEPSFTQVWAYHGWNMAYNISSIFSAPENRLRWVRNGIRLVRDEGLTYNPNDPELYRELGWFYQHKIGGTYDGSHIYYKTRFIEDVGTILPNGRITKSIETLPENDVLGDMDTDFMRLLDARYNGLDWRLPETVSTYYADLGIKTAGNDADLSLARMVYQNMRKLFFKGNLHVTQDGQFVNTADIYKLGPAMNAFTGAINHFKEDSVKNAFYNFLTSAIPMLILYEQENEARQAWEIGQAFIGREKMGISFEVFHSTHMPKTYNDVPYEELAAVIYAYHYRAALEEAKGDVLRAKTYESFGQKLWTNLSEGPEADLIRHYNIPPLDVIKQLADKNAKSQSSTP